VLYRGQGIVAYAATASALAVVHRDPQTGLDTVIVVPGTGDGEPTPLEFPAAGTVTSIRASPDGSMIGLTYTQPATAYTVGGDDLLFTYDLGRGGGLPELVPDARGEQISAEEWAFVPGSAQLVALTPAGRLLRVDAVDAFSGAAVAADLGSAATIRGAVASGVVVDLGSATAVVSADTLSTVPWTLPVGSVAVDATGDAILVTDDTLELVAPSGASTTVLSAADGIAGVCVSPNALYAAVTTGSGSTSVVSLAGAGLLVEVQGVAPSWCS
jgi:hypothetical protein